VPVSRLRIQISISLDGYVAGPSQSEKEPLGEGGEQLHEWTVKLEAWRASHGREGGERDASSPVAERHFENIGASIMGRNMFGGGPGPWPEDPPWNGWWGEEPPFHHPVFVLTHHAREAQPMQGGTTFHFVTDGIESALEQAREAAGGKDVLINGGAQACAQYLAAGLVDEMTLSVAPILLGGGARLFDGVGVPERGMELVEAVDAPDVTHLRYTFVS
jgi:dihydrofolate reductase